MKLFPSKSLFLALALFGMGGAFQAEVARADVTCGQESGRPRVCHWTSPWGSSVPIRVTVGKDQLRRLAIIASRRDNPGDVRSHFITNRADLGVAWVINGTNGDDFMVEVLRATGGTITHGSFTLSAPTGTTPLLFRSRSGNDVVIGGNLTVGIFTNHTFNGHNIVGGPGTDAGTKLFIIHPNDAADPALVTGHPGGARTALTGAANNILITGPSLQASANQHGRIFLSQGSLTKGGVFFCNLNSSPIAMMDGFIEKDRRTGPANQTFGMPDNTSLRPSCENLWANAVSTAYQPVQ